MLRLPLPVILGWIALLAAPVPAADEIPPEELRMDELVVTPNRIEQRRRDVAENVAVLVRRDLARSAAQTVDDLLRQVPGFSLFRRSSSLVAHPTTQGLSLRGIAPSGVSRTLVLLDGIPLNDPFGGWVYWSRVPVESLERIEVVRGGGSGVWGDAALGGVVHLFGERPGERRFRLTAQGGERETVRVDAGASGRSGPVGAVLSGSWFDTGGYPVVRADQRGAIDEAAASGASTFRGRLSGPAPGEGDWFLDGSWFAEDRDNGTALTRNATDASVVAAGGRWPGAPFGGEWRIDAFGQWQTFESTFSSQQEDRSAEDPALDQFDVPSTAVGASLQWMASPVPAHRVTAGADFRRVEGETNEDFRFVDGAFRRRRTAGGEQQILGVFAEDAWEPLRTVRVTAAVRGDLWRAMDLFRLERSLEDGSVLVDRDLGDRDRVALSPKLGLVWMLDPETSFRGLFYGGFRAPTLNELVRPFRVRNDITEANVGLDPERLLGGELGADWEASRARAGLTGFWNEIEDPIANVTIGSGPGTIEPCGFVPEGGVCRQRQNLGRSRIRGIEAEVEVVPARRWTASASWLFSDAEIVDAPRDRALEGNRLAQVPRHQVVSRLAWEDPRWLAAALQVRWIGDQFEDDQNRLRLADFTVVDLFLAREILPGVEIFAAGENLFDRTIPVGKTADGLITIGAPRLVRGGVRLRL